MTANEIYQPDLTPSIPVNPERDTRDEDGDLLFATDPYAYRGIEIITQPHHDHERAYIELGVIDLGGEGG
ncbi:MAG TPA: hypothetical protein VFD36_29580 [Kofleriaceae bacterium]|nr:hypothetical protein [Kofleriaceae bacterium]